MKKLPLLLIASLLASSSLNAQTGEAAATAAKANEPSYWQNWTFAAITLVIVGTSIYLISVNNGHSATH